MTVPVIQIHIEGDVKMLHLTDFYMALKHLRSLPKKKKVIMASI